MRAYLTDNVVIVRQVVSVSLGSGRRGVAQFPYVWLRAVGRCGDGEAVCLRLTALWAVLTAAGGQRQIHVINNSRFFFFLFEDLSLRLSAFLWTT